MSRPSCQRNTTCLVRGHAVTSSAEFDTGAESASRTAAASKIGAAPSAGHGAKQIRWPIGAGLGQNSFVPSPLDRLVRWWTRGPDVDRLEPPTPDDRLAEHMRAVAATLTRTDARLDFSVPSLAFVEAALDGMDEAARRRAAAYVGEVIVRSAPGAYWGRSRHGAEPGVAVGRWLADPVDHLERRVSGQLRGDAALTDYVAGIVEYARDPSGGTTERLGWKLVIGPGRRRAVRGRRHQ